MKTAFMDEKMLRRTMKAAVEEVLDERKDLMADLLEEALLDIGLARAIREGERSPAVSRKAVLDIVRSRA